MKKEVLNTFDKPFITVEYQNAFNWVYNNWMGYLSVNNVKDGANTCLEVLSETNCAYLLNDNRLVIGAWDHTNEWIATEWTPRAIAAGLRYFAHIVTPESFAELSAVAMNEQISGAFTMRIFNDIAEAKAWLRQNQLKEIQAV